jgi:protein MpaA
VLIVPDANPDGRIARRRGNAAGVDLNRDFPADNRGAARLTAVAQPESRLIAELVEAAQPHLIVSLHQPLACVDWDGPEPAATIAARMAAVSDLPARKLGARRGSLGAWAGETLGIPTITLELPGAAGGDEAADWERYHDALFVAVQSVTDAAAAARLGRDGAAAGS